MLRVAARHADIVGLLPAPIRGDDDRDDPLDRLPAALGDKLAVLRSAAGDRFGQLELSAFGVFSITARRRSGTEELIARAAHPRRDHRRLLTAPPARPRRGPLAYPPWRAVVDTCHDRAPRP